METKTIDRTATSAPQFAQLAREISRARMLVNDVIEDGKRSAQRTAKRTFAAAEDCVEDTTYYIKRHPWQAIGIAAGCGISAGLFVGWLLRRTAGRRGGTETPEFQAVER